MPVYKLVLKQSDVICLTLGSSRFWVVVSNSKATKTAKGAVVLGQCLSKRSQDSRIPSHTIPKLEQLHLEHTLA